MITSLQMHTLRERHFTFAASVNQRCISWLLHHCWWIPSALSSLPINPRLHPNLNMWHQSWVHSLSWGPRTPCWPSSWRSAKSGFLWAILSSKQLLWHLVTGASHCSLCINGKENFFCSTYCFTKIGLVQKFLVNEREEGKGSAGRTCSVCLIF